jgi:hypothetical protein
MSFVMMIFEDEALKTVLPHEQLNRFISGALGYAW